MFGILKKCLETGVVTNNYPKGEPAVSAAARGSPDISSAKLEDAPLAQAACPTAAISISQVGDNQRTLTLDLAKCIFCGACAEAAKSIRMTSRCELAATSRKGLEVVKQLQDSGCRILDQETPVPSSITSPSSIQHLVPILHPASIDALGETLKTKIHKLLGRSLHIREVDAGSCNGCEIEIVGLNSPVYDIERFGIHFVASPRHADLLLVTGPVTRNMEEALRKTYAAMPGPSLVVAVGACGCSGGIFGRNYATCGAVDSVIPVDVYIPGCPPNPYALLHGILLAVGRAPA